MVWLKLAVCILVILVSGKAVAKYGDILAERTGLGRVWLGVIAIALITSLPELFTGISAATIVNSPNLAVGDLVGANAFNMFNLAILDITHRDSSLLASVVSPAHRLTGWFSLLMVGVVAIALLVSHFYASPALGWIGWYTPVILILYFVLVRQVFQYEKSHPSAPEAELYADAHPTRRVLAYFLLAAVFIVGAGIWLATIGDEIARVTGLGQSFVGSLFLAFTTTLPELTVSFAAMRMGAADMAVANMVGSNLFNMTIIPITDIFFTRGPLLADVSAGNMITAASVIVLTLLFLLGLRLKPRRRFRLSWWNVLVIILFVAGTYFSFTHA